MHVSFMPRKNVELLRNTHYLVVFLSYVQQVGIYPGCPEVLSVKLLQIMAVDAVSSPLLGSHIGFQPTLHL
jgi:hypothetical protein